MRTLVFLDSLARDIGYAARLFSRRPVMTTTALITIALGIGVNASVFSVVQNVLWRPLSLPAGERLVLLQEVGPPPARQRMRVSPANAADWEDAANTLDALATISWRRAVIVEEERAEEISCAEVSSSFFGLLGAQPAHGRLLDEQDDSSVTSAASADTRNPYRFQPRVTVISSALWRQHFGGRPDVVGHRVRFRDHGTAEVVGVLGADFDFPMLGGADCWFPRRRLPDERGVRWLMVLGRLAPTATVADAQAEFEVIAAGLAAAHPGTNVDHTVSVTLLRDYLTAGVRPQLWFLTGGALCVLLIVCANVSNLLLANASARRGEFMTRMALGATRLQLLQQAVTESLLLACAGGSTGLLLATWAVPWIASRAPSDLPRLEAIEINGSVVAFAVFASLVVGVLPGFLAAAGLRRAAGSSDWRSGLAVRGAGSGYRAALIVAEVALALMLVVAAGLLVQTARAINALPLGFDTSNVISIGLSPDPTRIRSLGGLTELADRIRNVAGVLAAGIGTPPLGSDAHEGAISLPADPSRYVPVDVKPVGPGYFEALNIPLQNGRFIAARDDRSAPRVAVLNERASRLVFPGGAVGRTLLYEGEPLEVVGVVGDIRLVGLEPEPNPVVFIPADQSRITFQIDNIVVRTAGDPRERLPEIRTITRQFDPQLPLTEIETLDERLAARTAPRRFTLWLVLLFSVTAVGLAVVGIYGVVAEWVLQRVPEIGIRMTLGATPARVQWMVVRRGAVMIATGVVIGAGAALTMHELMSGFVFGVTTRDPASYVVASSLLTCAGLVACLVPARRACRVDPVTALRRE